MELYSARVATAAPLDYRTKAEHMPDEDGLRCHPPPFARTSNSAVLFGVKCVGDECRPAAFGRFRSGRAPRRFCMWCNLPEELSFMELVLHSFQTVQAIDPA